MAIDGHDLSHTHMTQRDAYGAEQILRSNTVCIPFVDFKVGFSQFVGFTIRELELLEIPSHAELAFRLHAIDGIVVYHTSIVLEEGAILAGDVNQGRRKTIGTRAPLCPKGRFRTSRIAVATATGVSRIDRSQATHVPIVVDGLHVVVQLVTTCETRIINP